MQNGLIGRTHITNEGVKIVVWKVAVIKNCLGKLFIDVSLKSSWNTYHK